MGRQNAKKKKVSEASKKGAAKNYITRTQAVRKLQLSLPDFRKLCIWKGIYPREPRNKKKVSKSATPSTTFYYSKDIQYLLHEPLVAKFRDQKALEKKISRALGRGDVSDAHRLERNAVRPEKTGKPRYTLNHVITERYPTFADALRDLDDCLSMLFLFANLPSTSTVPAKMIARCERLCLEFQHYLIVSHSLRKSFLSIKGIYYQATIQGEDILWLVPYKFNQRVVGDVDFRIMGTFVEFYMTLLGFVNLRLYTASGLKYPPRFDEAKDNDAGELGAFTLEGVGRVSKGEPVAAEPVREPDPAVQEKVDKLVKELHSTDANGDDVGKAAETGGLPNDAFESEEQSLEAFDKFKPTAPGGDILPQPSYSTNDPAALFSKCTFFLSRETPRQPLEFIIRSFGCKRVGWDAVLGEGAYTTDEQDSAITHQIVDRPPVSTMCEPETGGVDSQSSQKLGANHRIPGRIYVQPQWVWDSINDEELKRPDLYAPGAQLPPHFSPFVKNVHGRYDPTRPLEEQETQAEALESGSDADEDQDAGDGGEDNAIEDDYAVRAIADMGDSMEDGSSENGDSQSQQEGDDTFGGFSDEGEHGTNNIEDEETSSALRRQLELEAELTGRLVKPTQVDAQTEKKQVARRELVRQAKETEEDLERRKGMLPKKKRKLYEQMIYTNNKKSYEDEKLRAKRRKLEKQLAKGKA